jgi:Uma2 family endonuclease
MSDLLIAPPADRSRFSLHPEREVTEVPQHRREIEYIESNLRVELPHRLVGGNMGVYWVPGQFREPWVGPDVLVARCPPRDPMPRVYLAWEDGPILFVAEVASRRTRRLERNKRETNYRVDLQIPEYLYIDLDRHQLELWRLRDGEYLRVPEERGRLYSEELDLWFGWEDERQTFVRLWMPDGRRLLTKEEEWQRAQETERRTRDLEQRAQEAERRTREVEQRAQEAERRTREVEQRAQEAEARAAEMAAELERLRAATAEQDAGGPPIES